MKTTLGSLLFLLFFTPLFAKELATYTLTSNKTHVVPHEALTITFKATQQDHTDVMFFFLEPKKSDTYEIHLLEKKTQEKAHHDTTTTFTYILFAHKAQTLHVDFDFTIKTASDDAVAQVYTGSRDNVKWIETQDTTIALKPLKIEVEPLEHNVSLIGDFNLTCKLDKKQVLPYESVNILYTLKGTGYKNTNLTLLEKKHNITLFSEQNTIKKTLTPQGFRLHTNYLYALSATDDFHIDALTLKAYSPTKKRYYTLTTPSYDIKIVPLKKENLLDTTTQPTPQKPLVDFETLQKFFLYLMIFLSGYVSAHFQKRYTSSKPQQKKKYEDIEKAQTAKELLNIIFTHYSDKNLDTFISELEDISYGKTKGKSTFKEIKKKLLHHLR